MGLFTSQSHAQNYYYPDYTPNSYGYQGAHSNNAHALLGQQIYHLDQYGDQMTNLYAREIRNYCGCRNSAALLTEMRRYNGYTNSLITAYRGTCPKTYKTACCNVRNSLTRIQTLRTRARVSPTVCAYMTRSCPISTHLHRNYALFQPRPTCATPAPVVTYRQPVQVHSYGHTRYGHGHSQGNCGKKGGIDIGSAIFGAVAGRIIHGIINH